MMAGLVDRSVLVAGLLFVLISTVMSAQPSSQPGLGFAMIGIAIGESARVNALNIGNAWSTQDSSCSVTLQFLDTEGQLLKQKVVTLQSGKAASLDLGRGELPIGDDPRAEIRAVLLFGYYGGANPPPAVLHKFDCNIVPSLEVFDNNTGRTSFILTDAKQLPPPATPAQ
jgi:hypothetical protein